MLINNMKEKLMKAGILFILLILLPCLALSQGADGKSFYYVTQDGTSSMPVEPIFSNIQDAVNAADDPADIIKVAAGTYNDISTSGTQSHVVYINKTVSIYGGFKQDDWSLSDPENNNTIIDGQNTARCIYIDKSGYNALIDGFTIANGNAASSGGQGGGIYAVSKAATIRMCAISNNTACNNTGTGLGGGIFMMECRATIANNYFEHNIAGLTTGGNGGAMFGYKCDDSTVSGNSFFKNTASGSKSKYVNGGAIYFAYSSGLTITQNSIRRSIASANLGGSGGGIFITSCPDALIQNNYLTENKAGAYRSGTGGAIYAEKSNNLIIADNSITANIGASGYNGFGGAIYIDTAQNFLISLNEISGNCSATTDTAYLIGEGGGVYIRSGTGSVFSNIFDQNTAIANASAAAEGGALFFKDFEGDVSNNIFLNNAANASLTKGTGEGGAVYAISSGDADRGNVINFTDNIFDSNCASFNENSSSTSEGGACYIEQTSATLTTNAFLNNIASSSSGRGGALSFWRSGVKMTDNQFCFNKAGINGSGQGGAIYSTGYEESILIDSLALDNNLFLGNIGSEKDSADGGAIYIKDNVLATINNNTITSNTATLADNGEGGALYLDNAELSLTGNFFELNYAAAVLTGTGGAASIRNSNNLQIKNNNFTENAAMSGNEESGGNYGALRILDSNNINIDANVFMNNSPSYNFSFSGNAGALSLSNTNGFSITNNLFTQNRGAYGGVMYLEDLSNSDSSVIQRIAQNTISDNYSKTCAVYMRSVRGHSTSLTTSVSAGSLSVSVSSAYAPPVAGDRVLLYDYDTSKSEEKTVASLSGHTLTFESPLVNSYSDNTTISQSGISWQNNIIANNSGTAVLGDMSTCKFDTQLWYNNGKNIDMTAALTVNDIFNDPQFVDISYNDYHLRFTSPAIDKGINTGLAKDLNGNPRPFGKGYDIGAFEWNISGNIKDYLLGKTMITPGEKTAFDLNLDNNIDISDLIMFNIITQK